MEEGGGKNKNALSCLIYVRNYVTQQMWFNYGPAVHEDSMTGRQADRQMDRTNNISLQKAFGYTVFAIKEFAWWGTIICIE